MNHNVFQPVIPTIPDMPEQSGPFLHIVVAGRIRTLITRLLRRAPRALCGEWLWADPDRAEPGPCSPYCPACVAVSGLDEGEIAESGDFVPGYWIEGTR